MRRPVTDSSRRRRWCRRQRSSCWWPQLNTPPYKPRPVPLHQSLMRKTVVTLVIFAALVALGPSIPGLHGFSALRTAQFASVLDFRPRSSPLPPERSVATTRSPIEKPATLPLKNSPPPSVPFLFDQTGALTHFYQALARTEAKAPGAITRILHYGDSPVTADSITADARALF